MVTCSINRKPRNSGNIKKQRTLATSLFAAGVFCASMLGSFGDAVAQGVGDIQIGVDCQSEELTSNGDIFWVSQSQLVSCLFKCKNFTHARLDRKNPDVNIDNFTPNNGEVEEKGHISLDFRLSEKPANKDGNAPNPDVDFFTVFVLTCENNKATPPQSRSFTVRFGTDSDGDNLSDIFEMYVTGTNHEKEDSDGDGLNDGLELQWGLDPNKRDTDGDGRSDFEEFMWNMNPMGGPGDFATGVDDNKESGGDFFLNVASAPPAPQPDEPAWTSQMMDWQAMQSSAPNS